MEQEVNEKTAADNEMPRSPSPSRSQTSPESLNRSEAGYRCSSQPSGGNLSIPIKALLQWSTITMFSSKDLNRNDVDGIKNRMVTADGTLKMWKSSTPAVLMTNDVAHRYFNYDDTTRSWRPKDTTAIDAMALLLEGNHRLIATREAFAKGLLPEQLQNEVISVLLFTCYREEEDEFKRALSTAVGHGKRATVCRASLRVASLLEARHASHDSLTYWKRVPIAIDIKKMIDGAGRLKWAGCIEEAMVQGLLPRKKKEDTLWQAAMCSAYLDGDALRRLTALQDDPRTQSITLNPVTLNRFNRLSIKGKGEELSKFIKDQLAHPGKITSSSIRKAAASLDELAPRELSQSRAAKWQREKRKKQAETRPPKTSDGEETNENDMQPPEKKAKAEQQPIRSTSSPPDVESVDNTSNACTCPWSPHIESMAQKLYQKSPVTSGMFDFVNIVLKRVQETTDVQPIGCPTCFKEIVGHMQKLESARTTASVASTSAESPEDVGSASGSVTRE